MNHPLAFVLAMAHIAAALALLNGIVVTLGQGKIGAAALEGIARQPEARGALTSSMFIGMALAETTGIYGLVISILILFVRPLINPFIDQLMDPRFLQSIADFLPSLPI